VKRLTSSTKNLRFKKRPLLLTTLVVWAGLVAGCQSKPYSDFKPAVLSDSSAKSHSKLVEVISDELSTKPVTIAKNAFVDKSWIMVTKQARQTIDNHNIQGRDMQQPVKFQLMKNDNHCYLVLGSNVKRWQLDNLSCRYE
jgi:hypothetical protein